MSGNSYKLGLVLPVYNDWESLERLLTDLDGALAKSARAIEAHVYVIDDGSDGPQPDPGKLRAAAGRVRSLELIRLVSNQGHQRAIATGLCVAAENSGLDAVVVMDSDGEDRPEHIAALVESSARRPESIVVAARSKRSERATFKAGYLTYRILFRIFTGKWIAFGNYMLIPMAVLKRLIYNPNVGSHLAASVFKSKTPLVPLPAPRGKRYSGESRMNYTALVVLGLNAIAVYSEVALVRLLFLLGSIMVALVLGMLGAAGVRFLTELAIPGWATNVVLILGTMLLQSIIGFFFISFLLLGMRQQKPWVPARDYRELLLSREPLA